MRPSLKVDAQVFREACRGCDKAGVLLESTLVPFPVRANSGSVSSPAIAEGPLRDWIESQTSVLGLWLDRLIEEGDPGDLISMVHRQQLWLELMRERLGSK